MKSILLLLSCFALCLSSVVVAPTIHAQVPDSCLKMALPHDPANGYLNPDSIRIDSCLGSPTFGRKFARGSFFILFSQTIATLPWAKEDTIIEFSWTTIDTSFPNIRSAFQQLETEFGALLLRKAHPSDTVVNEGGNTTYYLRFSEQVRIDSIESRLVAIQLVEEAFYKSRAGGLVGAVLEIQQMSNKPFRIISTEHSLIVTSNNHYTDGRIVSVLGNDVQTFSFERTTDNQEQAIIDIYTLPNGIYFVVCGGSSAPFVKGGW
jgi:hypothetical protein